jgi:hypothetical protein
MVDSLVLRHYSKREEDERIARFAARINYFIRYHPHLVAECQDMTADPLPPEPERNSLEYMLWGKETLPRTTPAQLAVTGRNSERIKAIEQIPCEPAKPQPKQSGLSDIYRTLEAEIAEDGCS